jgi:hypothetical protein
MSRFRQYPDDTIDPYAANGRCAYRHLGRDSIPEPPAWMQPADKHLWHESYQRCADTDHSPVFTPEEAQHLERGRRAGRAGRAVQAARIDTGEIHTRPSRDEHLNTMLKAVDIISNGQHEMNAYKASTQHHSSHHKDHEASTQHHSSHHKQHEDRQGSLSSHQSHKDEFAPNEIDQDEVSYPGLLKALQERSQLLEDKAH